MTLNQSQQELLSSIVDGAMDRVYREDNWLILNRGMERSIGFRFSLYFYEEIKNCQEFRGLHVDLEYNKIRDTIKRTRRRPNGIAPDFLLHQRNSDVQNVLAIEFKGWWNTESRENDVVKLQDLVCQEGPYMYGMAYLIEIGKDSYEKTKFIGY